MPISAQLTTAGGSRVAVWHIIESAEELAAQLLHPEYFADKTASLKPDSRRLKEVLAVRCLLKAVAGEELNVSYAADGSPFLADGRARLSITHTDGYAAIIYHDPATVPMPTGARPAAVALGIDIERIGHRVARVADRFLQPEELERLAMCELQVCAQAADATFPADADALTLHLAWSAKETAYKVLGASYYDLQNKTCMVAVDAAARRVTLDVEGQLRPLTIAYDLTAGYVLTYAERG